jgi:hypothetical protein
MPVKQEIERIHTWGSFHVLANIFIFQALPYLFFDKTVWLSLDIITRIFAFLCILQIVLLGFTYLHYVNLRDGEASRRFLLFYYPALFSLLVLIALSYYLTEQVSDSFKFFVQFGMFLYMTLGIVGLPWYLTRSIIEHYFGTGGK